MAESHWLSHLAQRLQDTCINPDTGEIKDEKKASLYLRYQTTHTRAFHKSLNDLFKLRAEQRKAEFGFEAQKAKLEAQQAAEERQNERHEMKKRTNEADLFIKRPESPQRFERPDLSKHEKRGRHARFHRPIRSRTRKKRP